MCVLIRFFGFDYSLLTVDCYGPYTAKDGVCKFNGTVTSQCPSGSGVPRAYHAKNAYAVGQTVSTTYSLQNYIFYFLYVELSIYSVISASSSFVCSINGNKRY